MTEEEFWEKHPTADYINFDNRGATGRKCDDVGPYIGVDGAFSLQQLRDMVKVLETFEPKKVFLACEHEEGSGEFIVELDKDYESKDDLKKLEWTSVVISGHGLHLIRNVETLESDNPLRKGAKVKFTTL